MKGSENLWSEEELLTQMEEMQDQIELQRQEKEELQGEISKLKTQLSKQEQSNSSEISKLQSALQQAQRKLQEQSGQLVRLSESDLILQENEKLKLENRRLENEKKLCREEADLEVEAGKAILQKQADKLWEKTRDAEEREAQVKKKEKQADELIRNRQQLINEAVAAARKRISQENASWYGQIINDLRNTFFRRERILSSRVMLISLYALALSVILACRSGPYVEAIMDTAAQIRGCITMLWAALCHIADLGSGTSLLIPFSLVSGIIKKIIYVLVVFFGCSISFIIVLIIIGCIQHQVKKYLNAWQILLLLSVIIDLSVFFDNYIHLLYPVNAVWVGVIAWIIIYCCCMGYQVWKRNPRAG